MGRLIYSNNVSLDGYAADADGSFDWSVPEAGVHEYIADLVRPMGTHLYGRRLYEVMSFWETTGDPEQFMRDFGQLWRAADKIVYSRTMTAPFTARTRIESDFDAAAVRELVEASDSDVLIGGAELAGQAIAAGLVHEIHSFVYPVLVGGGLRWLPGDVRIDLELVGEHRFANGVVHLHHRITERA